MEGLTGNTMKDAAHIWKMLDEMADSDPEGYKKFIKKTMEEGEQKPILPKPFVCVETTIMDPKKSTLFINFCSWEIMKKPEKNSDPVAVTSGPLEKNRDQAGEHTTVRLGFHPYVLEESFKSSAEKDLLVRLGLDYVENHHKVKVSQNYKICQGLKFKGDPSTLRSRDAFYGKRVKSEAEQIQENISDLSPDSLLGKIHKLSTNEDLARPDLEERLSALATGTNINNNSNSSSHKKVGLIEEVSSTTVQLPSPKFTIELHEADGSKSRRLELRLELDGVESVGDCELDISEELVNLYVESKYELDLTLPEPILESEAKAKFLKKSSILIVTLPTQSKT